MVAPLQEPPQLQPQAELSDSNTLATDLSVEASSKLNRLLSGFTAFLGTYIGTPTQTFIAKGSLFASPFTEFDLDPMPADLKYYLAQAKELHSKHIEETCAVLEQMHEYVHALSHVSIDPSIRDTTIQRVAMAEILAKVLAYRKLSNGDEIPIAYHIGDDVHGVATYTVDKLYLDNGHYAYGLHATDADGQPLPPFVIFRGTVPYPSAEGALETLLADLSPEGIGWRVFSSGRQVLTSWLQEHTTADRKAIVIGHSLAGALATYTTVHLNDLVHKTYCFGRPGINKQTAEAWRALEDRPKLRVFNDAWDVIPYFGGRVIGDVFIVKSDEALGSLSWPLQAHNRLIFNTPGWELHRINTDEENESWRRTTLAQVQRRVCRVVYPVLHFATRALRRVTG